MKQVYFYIVISIFVLLNFNCNNLKEKSGNFQKRYERIVSLAPSITETIYELSADSKLIGVTNFCNYPEAAKTKKRIGGFSDINFEAIVKLEPDNIFLLPSHKSFFKKFEELNLNYTVIPQKKLCDIKDSIIKIGNLLNRKNKAKTIVFHFEETFFQTKRSVVGKNQKILVVVSRTPGELKNIFAAGKNSFYNDIIELCNCVNVTKNFSSEYPMLNSESVLSLNPDIIIEIFSPDSGMNLQGNVKKMKKDWFRLEEINAVKNNNIYYIIQNYAVIPGSRVLKLVEDFAKIVKQSIKGK